jgi:hypothetical protein
MIRKRKIVYGALLLLAFCLPSCTHTEKELTIEQDGDYSIEMSFASQPWSEDCDSLFFYFKILDKKEQKKVYWENLENLHSPDTLKFQEQGNGSVSESYVIKPVENQNRIENNKVFWLMIDRSYTIGKGELEQIKDIVRQIVEDLPQGCVYISFFDSDVTTTEMINKENFDSFSDKFIHGKSSSKMLYQSITDKFTEFANSSTGSRDTSRYLLLFTDGKTDHIKNSKEREAFMALTDRFKQIDLTTRNNIQIHAFKYGSNTSGDDIFKDICSNRDPDRTELEGGFYPTDDVAGVVNSMQGFINDLSFDYKLTLIKNKGNIYRGEVLTLYVSLEKDGKKAFGVKQYNIGTPARPQGKKENDMFLCIVLGLIIIFIAFFIIQVIIPYIKDKVVNFEKKYVVTYHPAEGVLFEACPYCQDPLEEGQEIVVKCTHKMHWDCWKDNGHKCVEYGQNCKNGVQFFFDKAHPFDFEKSPYYLKWVIAGMISALLIWTVYECLPKQTPMDTLTSGLLSTFAPDTLKDDLTKMETLKEELNKMENSQNLDLQKTSEELPKYTETLTAMQEKTNGSLWHGLLLGLILTFLFSYINEFRQKKGMVLLAILGRSLLGALAGFVAFLTGSIICIAMVKTGNTPSVDWIAWLLLGGSIALCLSVKTTIKWQDALIGGLVSGVVSFLILFLTSKIELKDAPSLGPILGFMFCSAGIGLSIVAKHYVSQKYSLKYSGERRSGEIAIHKWMNESGGSNEVTIGKSNHCIIQMNWDNSDNIQDIQARLYVDKKRKAPVLKVVENGMFYDGRDARKEELYQLRNGVKFQIGNTEFQYIEK